MRFNGSSSVEPVPDQHVCGSQWQRRALHVFKSRPNSVPNEFKTNRKDPSQRIPRMFHNSTFFEPGKSKPERSFVQLAVKQNQRLDGRRSNESRDVELTFGKDWGSVAVSMGDTKVLAQVTCEMGPPALSRPNEGKIHLNVYLGGVAFLDEAHTTHDQRSLKLNSLLERTFRSSRSIDLESLCVAVEKHVWCIRVNVNVLNHDGNLYGKSTNLKMKSVITSQMIKSYQLEPYFGHTFIFKE